MNLKKISYQKQCLYKSLIIYKFPGVETGGRNFFGLHFTIIDMFLVGIHFSGGHQNPGVIIIPLVNLPHYILSKRMNTRNGHCEHYNNVTLLIFIFLYQIGCPVENIHISFVSSALALNFFSQVKILNYTWELYWRICSKLGNEEIMLNYSSNDDSDFGLLASSPLGLLALRF